VFGTFGKLGLLLVFLKFFYAVAFVDTFFLELLFYLLLFVSLFSIFVGAVSCVVVLDLKSFLAYSSVFTFGVFVLGFCLKIYFFFLSNDYSFTLDFLNYKLFSETSVSAIYSDFLSYFKQSLGVTAFFFSFFAEPFNYYIGDDYHVDFVKIFFMWFEGVEVSLFYVLIYLLNLSILLSLLIIFQSRNYGIFEGKTLVAFNQLEKFQNVSFFYKVVYLLSVFSFVGLPPFLGFFSKFFLLFVLIKLFIYSEFSFLSAMLFLFVFVMLLGSSYYYLKFFLFGFSLNLRLQKFKQFLFSSDLNLNNNQFKGVLVNSLFKSFKLSAFFEFSVFNVSKDCVDEKEKDGGAVLLPNISDSIRNKSLLNSLLDRAIIDEVNSFIFFGAFENLHVTSDKNFVFLFSDDFQFYKNFTNNNFIVKSFMNKDLGFSYVYSLLQELKIFVLLFFNVTLRSMTKFLYKVSGFTFYKIVL